jgi:hypothetical protein
MRIIPLSAVIITSIVAIVLLSFGLISSAIAIIMILTLLSAYAIDQVIQNLSFREKFHDLKQDIDKNTLMTETIYKELQTKKIPCELMDPCNKHIWRFEKEMIWYNAPLVLAEDEIFNVIKKVYSAPEFVKAKYLFYKGTTEADSKKYAKRLKRYNSILKRLPDTGEKMKARVVSASVPDYSFFIGYKKDLEEAILYIMEKPFAFDIKDGGEPGLVFVIRDEVLIRRLKNIFNNEWAMGEPIK